MKMNRKREEVFENRTTEDPPGHMMAWEVDTMIALRQLLFIYFLRRMIAYLVHLYTVYSL